MYPLGITDNAKLIVRRQASEISTLKRKRRKKQKQREAEVRYILQFGFIMFLEEVLCLDALNSNWHLQNS